MIIDAQKWFIPGHPESLYNKWNITGHDRTSESIISSLDTVLAWANQKKLSVFITYEGKDTGAYNLPIELIQDLDSNRTTHYVKYFYAAPKHQEFNDLIGASKIDHWILIGAETDVCVYQTAKELLRQNKQVTLVEEAIYSGRNNTEVSRKNLIKFGANFISIKDLYSGDDLFVDSQSSVEESISVSNTVLTVYPNEDSIRNGDSKRLEYLLKYARIIGLRIEKPDSVTSNYQTRLVAGNFSMEQYNELNNKTNGELIVVADCTPQLLLTDIPKEWHVHTLKTVFYEFMETAAFYSKSIDELEGWQKRLKNAMLEGDLSYVESLQNE
jgi:nicotinamidase-related amidase